MDVDLNDLDFFLPEHRARGFQVTRVSFFARRTKTQTSIVVRYSIARVDRCFYSPRDVCEQLQGMLPLEIRTLLWRWKKKTQLVSDSEARLLAHGISRGNEKIDPLSFFSIEHQKIPGLVVRQAFMTWEKIDDEHTRTRIRYRIVGDRRLYSAPQVSASRFDHRERSAARAELERWKRRTQGISDTYQSFIPEWFKKDRDAFLTFLKDRCSNSVILRHLSYLERIIFPVFNAIDPKLRPGRWPEHFKHFNDRLIDLCRTNPSTRNKVRQTVSVFLSFYQRHHDVANMTHTLPLTERESGPKGVPVPGTLPSSTALAAWIRSMPSGHGRWIVALMAAFGIRLSEAMALNISDIRGTTYLQRINSHNTIEGNLVRSFSAKLLALTNKQLPRPIAANHTAQELENIDNRLRSCGKAPRRSDSSLKTSNFSGGAEYHSICHDIEFAKLIAEIQADGIALETARRSGSVSWYALQGAVERAITSTPVPSQQQKSLFQSYRPHDFRRLHITYAALFLWERGHSLELVALSHGHSTNEKGFLGTTRRYFQWALASRQETEIALIDSGQTRIDFAV